MRKSMTAGLLLALCGCASMPEDDRLQVSGRIDPALARESQCQVQLEEGTPRPVQERFVVDYVTEPGDRQYHLRVECRATGGRLLASQSASGRSGERLDLGLIAMSCPNQASESAQATVLDAIEREMQQRGGPKVTLVEVYGLLLDDDWALAEVAFDRLGPTLFVLQREDNAYRVRSHFSGSPPGRAPTPVAQRRLAENAPGVPARLLACYPPPAPR